jgi:fatty acid desaturase
MLLLRATCVPLAMGRDSVVSVQTHAHVVRTNLPSWSERPGAALAAQRVLRGPRMLTHRRETEVLAARRLLLDLARPDPRRYWRELAAHTVVGWSALVVAVSGVGGRWGLLGSTLVAALAMHRATAFLHELTHLNDRAIPRLRAAWNLAWGVPFFVPSWLYERCHLEHHRRGIYGTEADPEYLPLARMGRSAVVASALMGLLLPAVLVIRFMVLGPLAWSSRMVRLVVDARLSSLAPNLRWLAPEPDVALRRRMRVSEVACCAWAWGLSSLVAAHWLPLRALGAPLAVMTLAMALNQVRAHTTHRFQSEGAPLDEAGMLADSINVEVTALGRLLFPLNVNLHALHHLAPAVPFHNLERAHRRLVRLLPSTAGYRDAAEPGAWHALAALLASSTKERHP